jgi:hypothetical protein
VRECGGGGGSECGGGGGNGVNGGGIRAESRNWIKEQRAEGRAQRAESRGQRAEGRGQRTESREQRAESRKQEKWREGERRQKRRIECGTNRASKNDRKGGLVRQWW